MGTIYVARSANLGKWSSDVGLSKHVFKIGVTDNDPNALVAENWAGETDWAIVATRELELPIEESDVIERLARKEKLIEPNFYPKLKGTLGVFKVLPAHVENHIIVAKALAGGETSADLKLKPVDFGNYLIHNALR